MHSASPALIACEASITALRPEPQTLLMVSGRDRGRETGVDQRLAGGSLAGAALHHLPHDHFFDRRGVHPGAGDGLADDHGAELRRGEAGETAEVLADRGADGGEDDGGGGVAHGLLRVRAESKIAGIDSTVTRAQ